MADDKIMVEGIRVFAKHANAPDFVKASLVVTLNDFVAFCKAHPELQTEYDGKKQLRLQLLESQGGKLYLQVDTYKPKAAAPEKKDTAKGINDSSDLPF